MARNETVVCNAKKKTFLRAQINQNLTICDCFEAHKITKFCFKIDFYKLGLARGSAILPLLYKKVSITDISMAIKDTKYTRVTTNCCLPTGKSKYKVGPFSFSPCHTLRTLPISHLIALSWITIPSYFCVPLAPAPPLFSHCYLISILVERALLFHLLPHYYFDTHGTPCAPLQT